MILFLKIQKTQKKAKILLKILKNIMTNLATTVTKTVFSEGEFGTLYSSSVYGNDGNDRIGNRDTRGNTISYNVDADTSKTEKITDRMGNITGIRIRCIRQYNKGRIGKILTTQSLQISHTSITK